jgi:hypothetical protein
MLNIRTISVDILCICGSPIAVGTLIGVCVGRAGRLMSLEEARGWVPRVLLTLHQLTETRNAGGHAKGTKSKISLRGSFNVLRSTECSTATARLVERIGFASARTGFDSVSPRRLRALFTVLFRESLEVA